MGATPHRWAKAASPRSRSGVLVGQLELGLEQLNAVVDGLQRCLAGVHWVGQRERLVGSEPGAGGDQHRRGEVLERLADRGWCGNQ
jgi:hypothetical protein